MRSISLNHNSQLEISKNPMDYKITIYYRNRILFESVSEYLGARTLSSYSLKFSKININSDIFTLDEIKEINHDLSYIEILVHDKIIIIHENDDEKTRLMDIASITKRIDDEIRDSQNASSFVFTY